MQLKNIQIKNFRSIKDSNLSFSTNCLVLLGKNEAGKSNILKAIAAVFGKYKVSDKDKRKRIENEKIDDYYVMATFALSAENFKAIEKKFLTKYSGSENIIFKSGIKYIEYIKKVFKEFLIKIDIANTETPNYSYWEYNNNDIELEKPLFISGTKITDTGTVGFNLLMTTFTIIKEMYLENPITCHYWQYSDDFLLPGTINIDNFLASPSKYPSLENIFTLCGRENVNEEFENAIAEDGDYSNLFEQVSKKVTHTFQKIWKDFKGTAIQLLPNGEEILIKVVDKAKYSFEDRSDGFKKFISILLMLSTKSRSNKILENDLILIDEPDQSLYPTSAQYLRDELIEISNKSKVLFSTHSQYMIDPNFLERHIVVEKKDDITTIKKANTNSPYSTDELLRRAIGSSIFECLKPKNIIFEGYLDKKLFEKYCQFHKKDNAFQDYGSVYLGGISGVESLVQILILVNKKFIIVADSDETSKNRRIEFEKNYPDFKKNWLAYADVATKANTMEDFIESEHIEDCLKKVLGIDYEFIDTKSSILNIEKAVLNDKEKKQEIKNNLVQNIKAANIVSDYGLYIEALKEKLKEI